MLSYENNTFLIAALKNFKFQQDEAIIDLSMSDEPPGLQIRTLMENSIRAEKLIEKFEAHKKIWDSPTLLLKYLKLKEEEMQWAAQLMDWRDPSEAQQAQIELDVIDKTLQDLERSA
jgi:hypothetical protein